jgi:hypothetical protein
MPPFIFDRGINFLTAVLFYFSVLGAKNASNLFVEVKFGCFLLLDHGCSKKAFKSVITPNSSAAAGSAERTFLLNGAVRKLLCAF